MEDESKRDHEFDRSFYSMFPSTRVPLWVPIFDPQPKNNVPSTTHL